jgi:hypothetical protein
VRLGVVTTARLSLASASGAVVYDEEQFISPFQPAQIDMSSMPAGVYTLIIEHSNTRIIRSLVKL